MLLGVVAAEQQLAAVAQQRPYLRSCATAVTANVADEHGLHGRCPGRDHLVTPELQGLGGLVGRWCRSSDVLWRVRTVVGCAAVTSWPILVSPRSYGGEHPFIE